MFFIATITTLKPTIIGSFIDYIIAGKLTEQSLLIFAFLLIGVPIVVYISDFFYHTTMHKYGHKLSKELRILYLGKLFSLDSSIFEEYNKGEIISRVSNDLPNITLAVTGIMTELLFCSTLLIVIMYILIFHISLKLTLIAFTIIPITFLILNFARTRARKYYLKHRKIFARFFETTLESIEGSKVIRAYTQEENEYLRNEKAILEDIASWKYIVKFETIFTPLFETTIAISTFLTFSVGTMLVFDGSISPGELITFSMYIAMVSGPILALANIYNQVNQATISGERYFEILEKDTKIIIDNDKVVEDTFKKLEFNNVSFKYPFDENETIKNINLKISVGETIGIVGPTGSGKSTLIRQILREFHITSGDIKINGKPISKYDLEHVRDLIGYVPQVNTLFRGSVKENLIITNQVVDQIAIEEAIRVSAFEKDLENMPKGVNTFVGEGGDGLSGGQKQRLSIARALMNNKPILILDDSLSAVDGTTEKEIIGNIKETRKGKTNIIISHRFSVIKEADKIIVLQNGEVQEVGTHKELMKNRKWYYEQYNNQVRG